MVLLPENKKIIINWIIAILLPILFIVPTALFSNLNISDIFLIPGVIYLSYIGLRFVYRCGTFDTFGYQFSSWFTSWQKNSPKRYKDAYEYKKIKTEERSRDSFIFLPYLIIGSALVLTSIILAIVLFR